jgi:hypothetical protein
MKHLDERTLLLGLIVNTLPFDYEDNKVSSNFSLHIEISELEKIKSDLEVLKSKESLSDEERTEISDEIYFINKIIESLEMK